MKLILTAGDKHLYEDEKDHLPFVWFSAGAAHGLVNDNLKHIGSFKNVRRAVEWATDKGYFGGE